MERAGPENPGPRALRAETGLMIFHLRVLCPLCAGRWVVTRELLHVNVLCIEQMYMLHFVLVIYGRATTKVSTHAVNWLSKFN